MVDEEIVKENVQAEPEIVVFIAIPTARPKTVFEKDINIPCKMPIVVMVGGAFLYKSRPGKTICIKAGDKFPTVKVTNDADPTEPVASVGASTDHIMGSYALPKGIDLTIGKTFSLKITGRRLGLDIYVDGGELIFDFER